MKKGRREAAFFFLTPWCNYINVQSRPNRSGFSLLREKPKISSQP